MKQLGSFHHYSTAHHQLRLPIEMLEEQVVALLVESSVPDADRDSSIAFELKHSSAVTQFARLLAHKRQLPIDTCAAGALLHDIYVVTSGSYKNHAQQGVPIAMAMLSNVGGFSDVQKQAVTEIVGDHSDKHIFSRDPFREFGKDVDVLDAFLYPGAFEWYLGNKPMPIFAHYLTRAKTVWDELGLRPDPRFSILADYGSSWLDASCSLSVHESDQHDSDDTISDLPPALAVKGQRGWIAHYNCARWGDVASGRGLSNARGAVKDLLPALVSASREDDVLALMLWPQLGCFERIAKTALGDARLTELSANARHAGDGAQHD
jgi:HD domain